MSFPFFVICSRSLLHKIRMSSFRDYCFIVSFGLTNSYFRKILHLMFVIYALQFVQGAEVQICQNVQPPPMRGNEPENCSLVCSLKFHHAVTSTTSDEITLCLKNSSLAVFCDTHNDCRLFHVGAYCKPIPCLCRAKSGPKEAYIFDPFFGVHKIHTCVVSSKYVNLDQPMVPFPWKTLLIVCAIVFVFAAFLICLRWVSPFIRSMHAKRSSRNNRQRQAVSSEDNTSLFPPVAQPSDSTPFTYYFPQGLPRIYRASPRRSQRIHRASRARYTNCAQGERTVSRTLSNEDKPPPYEAAIQLPPPAYEEVARVISEGRSVNAAHEIRDQRVEIHVTAESPEPALSSV